MEKIQATNIGIITSKKIDSNQDQNPDTFAFVLDIGEQFKRGDEVCYIYRSEKNLNINSNFSFLTSSDQQKIQEAKWTFVKSIKAKESTMQNPYGEVPDICPVVSVDISRDINLDTQIKLTTTGKQVPFDGIPDNFSIKFVFASPTFYIDKILKYWSSITRSE